MEQQSANIRVICMSIRCNNRKLADNEDYFRCPGSFYPRGRNEAVSCPVTLCSECGEKQAESPDGHKCMCGTYWFAPIFHQRNVTPAAK